MIPLKTKWKRFENGLRDLSEEEEIVGARLVGGRRWRFAIEDNIVHLNDFFVDLRDERVEAVQKDATLTQGLDIANPVEDQEEDRVEKMVAVVYVGLWL